jgi:hypothetical protein
MDPAVRAAIKGWVEIGQEPLHQRVTLLKNRSGQNMQGRNDGIMTRIHGRYTDRLGPRRTGSPSDHAHRAMSKRLQNGALTGDEGLDTSNGGLRRVVNDRHAASTWGSFLVRHAVCRGGASDHCLGRAISSMFVLK